MHSGKQLFLFRPGEEARMLARCQFGIDFDGLCGVTLTYPIKGYPWRKNIRKSYKFEIHPDIRSLLFDEIHRLSKDYPEHCLGYDQLWNDSSEKGNGVARDKETGTLCYAVAIIKDHGEIEIQYSLREDSVALISSKLLEVITKLIESYEKL